MGDARQGVGLRREMGDRSLLKLFIVFLMLFVVICGVFGFEV